MGNSYQDKEYHSVIDEIIAEERLNKPKSKKKQISYCKKCGEPTTHEFIGQSWLCLCCESGKGRTKSEIKKIKKQRKGWANNYKI